MSITHLITVELRSAVITPDILRMLAIPIFVYAAYLDYQIRRVYNEIWVPLIGLCFITLSWDMSITILSTTVHDTEYFFSIIASIVFVPSLAFTLWKANTIGGADAKGIVALSLCFPTAPTIVAAGNTYPLVGGITPVFGITVLLNALLLSWVYHIGIVAQNMTSGDYHRLMFHAVKRDTDSIHETRGSILTRMGGRTVTVDADTIRMYFRWRDITYEKLQSNPDSYRQSDPVVQHEFTDGAVPNTTWAPHGRSKRGETDDSVRVDQGSCSPTTTTLGSADVWSADLFITELQEEGKSVTVCADELRAGLDAITTQSSMWVSPSVPFFIPLSIGLVIGLAYGSLFSGVTGAIAELIVRVMTSV